MTELKIRLLAEVEFWEQFIREWKTDFKGPLPAKAQESLSYAKRKMDQYLIAETKSAGDRLK